MSTVEERVVKLTFDNAAFEKAIQQTITDLAQLENSLDSLANNTSLERSISQTRTSLSELNASADFSNVLTGFTDITNAANSVDVSSIEVALTSLESRFSAFGVAAATVISNIVTSLTTTLSNAISSVLSSTVSGGITRVLNLQQAYFTMEGLLDSEEEIEEVMSNVNDAVTGTAYSLDAAASVAAQLVASGVEPGEDMLTVLTAIAGVAAQTGSEYSDIGSIFTTIAANGKVMTEQIRQFSYRGLNASSVLADYLGVELSEVADLVSDGEVSFSDFAQAMYDAFGTHAQDANKTFSGVTSNIKSALSRIGAAFVEDILENEGPMVTFLNALKTVINDVNTNLTDLADSFSDFAIDILANGQEYLENLDMTHFWENFYTIINNVTSILSKLWSFIKQIFSAISEGFDANFSGTIGDAVASVTTGLLNFVNQFTLTEEILDSITTISSTFFKVIKLGADILWNIADALSDVLSSEEVKDFIKNILKLGVSIAGVVENFISLIDELGIVDTIFEIVGSAGEIFGEVASSIGDIFGNLGEFLSTVLSAIAGGVKEIFSFITSSTSTDFLGTLVSVFFSARSAGRLYTIVKTIADFVTNLKNVGLVSFLLGLGSDATNALTSTTKSFSKIAEDAKKAFSTLTTSLKTMVKSVSAVAVIGIAVGVYILAAAMIKLSDLELEDAITSLGEVVIIILALAGAMTTMVSALGANGTSAMTVGISLVAIAASIYLMAQALQQIGSTDMLNLVQGIIGLAVILVAVRAYLNQVSNITTALNKSKRSSISSAIAIAIELIAFGLVLKLIASTLDDFSSMSLGSAVQSLVIMAICIAEILAMTYVLSLMEVNGKTLAGALAMVVLGLVLLELAAVVDRFSEFDLTQLAMSSLGFTYLFTALALVLKELELLMGNSNLSFGQNVAKLAMGLLSLQVLIIDLFAIYVLLKLFAEIDTDAAVNSIAIMLSTCTMLVSVLAILGELGSGGMLLGVASMTILVIDLIALAIVFQMFSGYSLGEVGTALLAMGGALTELTAVIVILTKSMSAGDWGDAIISVAGFTLLSLAMIPLAIAFQMFAGYSLEDVGTALLAMGGALTELTAVIVVLTNFTGSKMAAALVGAVDIAALALSLMVVAEALERFAVFTPDEAVTAVTVMGIALGEMTVVVALLSALGVGSAFALIGAAAIAVISLTLIEIAEAIERFGSIDMETGLRGIQLMELALLVIAEGSIANSLGIIGSLSIAIVADALTDIAEAVLLFGSNGARALIGAKVMGTALSAIADGLQECGLDTVLGSLSVDLIADDLGTLADSVKAWNDVTVDEDLSNSIKTLATALTWFGWSDLIASGAIYLLGEPLGELAESVKAWEDITITDTLGENLQKLAEGISYFGLGSIISALSVKTVITPLSDLATAVLSWVDVQSSDLDFESLSKQLGYLASGIKAFGADDIFDVFDSFSGSQSSIAEVLPSFVDTLISLSGVEFSDDVGKSIESIAEAIAEFNNSDINNIKFDKLTDLSNGIATLFTSLSNAENVNYSNITYGIYIISSALSNFYTDDVDTFVDSIDNMKTSVSEAAETFYYAGSTIADNLSSGFSEYLSSSTTTDDMANDILERLATSLSGNTTAFDSAGDTCCEYFLAAFSDQSTLVVSECSDLTGDMISAIKDTQVDFEAAGYYLVEGLATGITSGKYTAINAAIEVATATLAATQTALNENSPSKATMQMGVYFDEGLSLGISSLSDDVASAASSMGQGALSSLVSVLNGTGAAVSSAMSIDSGYLNSYASSMSFSARSLSDSISSSGTIQSSTAAMQQALLEDNMRMFEANNKLATELSELRSDMNSYTSALSNMETAMYVDGRKLASTIAKPMNQSLSTLSKRGKLA